MADPPPSRLPPPDRRISILDSLGSEIIGVMCPVSVCMLLVVLLVSVLSPPHDRQQQQSSSSYPTAATLVYQESPSDPPWKKLEGALLNSLVFVLLVAAVTFLLLLLYYYRFTNLLHNYMRFSAFIVLSSLGGSLLLSLLRRLLLPPLDAPTFLLLLLNLSAVGVLAVLSTSSFPIVLRQSYMVSLAVVVAAWLTKLPEWTTWTLLLALAVYDLVAVLSPGGPLKLLVELASSRDDDLPAFVYEARPSLVHNRTSPIAVVNLQVQSSSSSSYTPAPVAEVEMEILNNEDVPLVNPREPDDDDEEETVDATRGIKLGLGDFVFYSVLVGRAAMYDWMTVYACYLAIITGLGCTLILLAVFHKALPALPISITLGVMFYFLTRLLMEPFVVGLSTSLGRKLHATVTFEDESESISQKHLSVKQH